jgi:iron complex outermembrane receptor protein
MNSTRIARFRPSTMRRALLGAGLLLGSAGR